ncbi:MAG TPA: LysR family transcriptional regulator, partial [Gaiellaceae bacterium]|nr:LysR family transcriptional regulator [Gaiellaceae bacterium]
MARTCSFAKAAAELGYSQPAISQQIAGLERIVGTRLFERGSGPRPVKLTAAGELLLRHVEVVQARLAAAQADLEALVAGESGTLRIGTFQSVAARVLPPLVQQFASEWPDVDIRLTERDDDTDLLALVERGELDLAFVMLPLPEGPFDAVEVVSDDYVLISQPDAALASVADLDGVPLIGFRQCRSHSLLEDALRALGIEPNVVFRSDDNGTVQSFVATGMGVAVMPRLAVDVADPRVNVVPLPELEPR